MKKNNVRERIFGFFTLFTSTSTLLCCALPASLAALAGGAAVTSFLSIFPWLIPLSRYKEWIFLIAAILIIISAVITFHPRGKLACSIAGGDGCEVAGNFSRIMFFISVTVYLVSIFFAYFLTPILRWLDSVEML